MLRLKLQSIAALVTFFYFDCTHASTFMPYDRTSHKCHDLMALAEPHKADIISFDSRRLQFLKENSAFEGLGFREIKRAQDLHSPIGAQVVIENRYTHKRKVGRIVGVTISSFYYLDGEGEIRRFNTWDHRVLVKSSSIRWQNTEGASTFQEAIERTRKPFAIVTVHLDDKGRSGVMGKPRKLIGHVSLRVENNRLLFVITTTQGVEHMLDANIFWDKYLSAWVTTADQISTLDFAQSGPAIQAKKPILSDADRAANNKSHQLFWEWKGRPGTRLENVVNQFGCKTGDRVLLLGPQLLRSLPHGSVVWDVKGQRYVLGVDRISFAAYDSEAQDINTPTYFGLMPEPLSVFKRDI